MFLSLAVMVTFTPLVGGDAYAASKLKAPKLKVSSVTDQTVTLSWSKVSKAKGYKVYRKIGSKYKPVKKTKNRKITIKGLNANTSYKFKVCATSKTYYKGPGKYSKAVTAKTGTTISKATAAAAQKLFKVSAKSTEYAESLSKQLAFNPEYWDSKEGWRTAGSAAEHKAAKYIKKEFEKIGLSDVHLEKGAVDKWQFNGATLEVNYENEDGVAQEPLKIGFTDDENDSIISYASSGTVQAIEEETVPEDTDYSNIEIVDCGSGSMDDLVGIDITGKLALVGIDQYNKVWITQAYNECYTQGAAGVIAYQKPETGYITSYANYDKDTNHVQDICSDNLGIPCTDISYSNAQKIINILDSGKNVKANLFVDNQIIKDGGYTYNVVGKIPGKSSTGQQMIYAGHYDKYFYGFEDDCLATGLVGGIAKAMIDSGYKPANDIYFIAHGAEEWGQSGTDFDWATGSWRTITENHPEWQGTTLALFNFELPAIDNGNGQIVLSSVENAAIAKKILKSGVLAKASKNYDYIATSAASGFVSSDAICFEQKGVPSHMNYTVDSMAYDPAKTCWKQNRYHTQRDTINETETMFGKTFGGAPTMSKEAGVDGNYSKLLLKNQIETWGALGISYDQTPALVLDFQARTDYLYDKMFDENGKNFTAATSSQASEYKEALSEMSEAAAANKAEGNAINKKYNAAIRKCDNKAATKARKEALSYNAKSLKAFKAFQEGTVAIEMGGLYTDAPHKIIQDSYDIYASACDTLENGGMGAYYNLMAALWGPEFDENFKGRGMAEDIQWFSWAYGTTCSEETLDRLRNTFTNDEDNWGMNVELLGDLQDVMKTTNKMYKAIYYDADLQPESQRTAYVQNKYSDEFITLLKAHKKAARDQVRAHVTNEIKAIYQAEDAL